MTLIAVDADRETLKQLAGCLQSVFPETETVTFDNALSSFKYYLSHVEEVAQIYFPLTIKPFDGFKFASLLEQSAFAGNVIFTTQTDNDEIRELIRLNGRKRYISKPITPEKIRALAAREQDLCLDRHDGNADDKCVGCIYHWCGNRRSGNTGGG